MKHISHILLVAVAVVAGLGSCNVARAPKATPEQAPFFTLNDVEMNRDAVYALVRGIEGPNTLNTVEYQGDLYHLNIYDNNSVLPIYAWQKQGMIDNGTTNSYYGSYYSILMQTNYFLMRTEEFLGNPEVQLTENEKALVRQYMGELKTLRALAHWRLVLRFSKPWDGTTDNQEHSGIILVTSYNPLEIAKQARASRSEVYAQIMKDLDEAIDAIPEEANKDVKPSMYVNKEYAYALKARAALTSQNWAVAKECAQKVMDKFPLTQLTGDRKQDIDLLNKIWRTDDSDEIVVRLFASPQIGAAPVAVYGAGWAETFANFKDPKDPTTKNVRVYRPTLMLEKWVIDLYQEEDLRRECYVKFHEFFQEGFLGQGLAYWAITKFAGNKKLDKDPEKDEWKVSTHLFNAAEAYLIYAEACYNLGDYNGALQGIEKVQTARGLVFEPDRYADPALLLQEIKNERTRELVGEGWRFLDIVRWGEDVNRGEPQAELAKTASLLGKSSLIIEDGANLQKKAGDEMFIWEFPTRDIQNNPNLKAHKNWN